MPIILQPNQALAWLHSPDDLKGELAGIEPKAIRFCPVSRRVNRIEGEDLIRPIQT